MSPALMETRQRLEAKIKELVSLMNLLDGDPDLEESGDTEENGDELDLAGDEQDYSGDEGDQSVGRLQGGCGL